MLPLHWMKKSFVGPVFVLRKETQLFPAWRDSLVVAAAQIGDCRYLLTEDLQVNQTLGNINIIKPFHTSPESLKERWTSVSSPQLLKPPPCLEIEIHAAAFFMGCSGYTTTFPTSRPPMIAQGITKTLSAADYRERRLKDLEDRRNSEMWRAGTELLTQGQEHSTGSKSLSHMLRGRQNNGQKGRRQSWYSAPAPWFKAARCDIRIPVRCSHRDRE